MDREKSADIHEIARRARSGRLDTMPALPCSAAILLSVYICICMVYLSRWHVPAFAGTVLLLTALMAALTLRSPWLIGMMAVPCVLVVAITGSLTAAALPIALLCGIAYGAFLLVNVRSLWMAAVPLSAFVLSLLITGNWWKAMLSLVGLPAALMLAYSLRRGTQRVRTICHLAIALAIPLALLAIGCLLVHLSAGTVADLSSAVTLARQALAERLAAWETGVGENAGRVVLEGMEFALAATLFNILPGVVIALLAVFSYMTDLVCLTLFRTYERDEYLPHHVFVSVISLPAALVFLTVHLLVPSVVSGVGLEAQFATVVAENIYLALFPAMILAGSLRLLRTVLFSPRRGMWMIIAILLLAISPGTALTVLALIGALSVLWGVLRRRLPRPRSK